MVAAAPSTVALCQSFVGEVRSERRRAGIGGPRSTAARRACPSVPPLEHAASPSASENERGPSPVWVSQILAP
jgi:hypothetical protein